MKKYETQNYVFYYQENSTAERDIAEIAKRQQLCFQYICQILKASPQFKIEYYLCETAEEVGRIYGDNEPCNGFADSPNKIYAVYNPEIQCIGFHEDAHIVSYTINQPDSPAIREGLAMYFDRKWWGIHNLDWTVLFMKTNRFIPIDELLDAEKFYSVDCSISYPIMGAFTDWLIFTYGIDRYLEFYKYDNSKTALQSEYKQSPEELNQAFIAYINLFETSERLEQAMEELLAE